MQAKNCFRRVSGFTLVELMVTVSIAAILLAVGVPPFSRLIANNRMATQTNEFVAALNTARSEAVRRGTGVGLRSDAGSLDFTGGWKVFIDADMDGAAPAAADVLRVNGALPGKAALKRVTRTGSGTSATYTDATTSLADRMYLVFNGRGGNNRGTDAFFRVCDTGNTALGGRVVRVSTVGRISLETTTAACS